MIWTGRGLALTSVFFWGASYVWGKMVMTWLPPFAVSGLRFGLGAVVLLVGVALVIFGVTLSMLPARGHHGRVAGV